MIVQLFAKRQKGIAAFFFSVMYAGLALPLLARANETRVYITANHVGSAVMKKNIFSSNHKSNNTLSPAFIKGISIATVAAKNKSFFNSPKHLSSGPTQPEMQSFQSVNANNMVDLFTGDFSYNIPLLDVGGYPINIHYSSGITMDQEASWVGLGWNINPGTITRNMRGLPDDFNGTDQVEKTLSLKKNKTIGVTAGVNVELLGGSLTLGASVGTFHNTYKGWGTETGINAGINAGSAASGSMTLGLGVTNNSQNGLDVSPSLSFKSSTEDGKTTGSVTIGTNYNSRTGINSLQMSGQISQQEHMMKNDEEQNNSQNFGGISSTISFSKPAFTPTVTIPFTSAQYSFKVKLGGELWGLHPDLSVRGYGSVQQIADVDKIKLMPAYGYLYFQNAKNIQGALLDFNREKEMAYRETEPHIAVPMYTYDSYCITGEGTGGMFRPYRSDIGFVFDHAMSSKSNSSSFALDLGFGGYFHGGIDYDGIIATTKNNPWIGDNILKDVIQFKTADSTFEPVYFKNPGEKTAVDQNFYSAIGDSKLMRVDLSPLTAQNSSTVTATRNFSTFTSAVSDGKFAFNSSTYRKQRDKRSQMISYLKAIDANYFALDKTIRSYNINSFPTSLCNTNYTIVPRVDSADINSSLSQVRKPHHLSEITVLNSDGRRYVYGVPVYNFLEKEVTFSVDQKLNGSAAGNLFTGQIKYDSSIDNTTNNNKGIDNYFNRETVPSYAHSFLLSGILSPDYVDITGDGITEDDNGEAIKFNYSRIYNKATPYTWRAPFDSAAYNEGLKTDNRDEKGSYSYGEREVWYLNSVESKTMMATFVLDTIHKRLDGYGVKNENGKIDSTKGLYRLQEIDLYAKADFIKNGLAGAKPIKTIHFEYSYELCKKNPSSLTDSGKLTLKKIWFTYNNNNKGKLNPYVFTYDTTKNPNYLKGAVDRWGNYKDSRNNPSQIANADYPYTNQTGQSNNWDSTKAASTASAWTLNNIQLPSGGQLKMTYESDDYAYVQNKRAMQLFSIAGFGSDSSSTPVAQLYPANTPGQDYQYVFINITDSVNSKDDIKRKYLDGVSKLYFKLLVKVPADIWGKGSEYVPFYADIDAQRYGMKGTSSSKMIWIKLLPIPDGAPPAVAAVQFLRLNLPSKAYPFSEPGDNVDAADFIKMILTAGSNISDGVSGFGAHARKVNHCDTIIPASSFVRLDNPSLKKLGGGLRVKKIEVYDNFHFMSKSQQQDATYGQQYDYSTTQMINNVPTRISSGVAAFEPAIGGEENPFHVPIEYVEHIAPLAPTNYKYTEEPLGESYFPGPMVGYSKVTVQTTKNDKKSATGREVTEFYTTNDFPTLWEFTPLDNESKKTFNPPVRNFFKFFAQHNVTLSQGFKVELNDMNGKLKSQSSYAQTDLVNPISYTYNYYNVVNDNTLKKQLSNNVTVIDSANGTVNSNGQLGKDIEVMVDLREQTSKTVDPSIEFNVDVVPAAFFPLALPSLIPSSTSETNRYRSVAVLKVVNRYGILDSVVHIEKGSKVSTKNMIYDSETGEVVLSRTNNEFDDPIYNFVYPSHWAYTGMSSAYQNQGATFSNVSFKQGKMYDYSFNPVNVSKFFESGDELMVRSQDKRDPTAATDTCANQFYSYVGDSTFKKIWAIDAAKGNEGNKGINFFDKTGMPFSATMVKATILRSGKRNMPSMPVGSITSLVNPVRTVSGTTKIVFDTLSQVITASAAQFKDFWRADSSLYRKDTTIITRKLADSVLNAQFVTSGIFSINRRHTPPSFLHHSSITYFNDNTGGYIKTYSQDPGGNNTDSYAKTWMKFEITTGFDINSTPAVPKNAVITSAFLFLANNAGIIGMPFHSNLRGSGGSNQSYLRQTNGGWITDYFNKPGISNDSLFNERQFVIGNSSAQDTIKATPLGQSVHRNDTVNVKTIVQRMVDSFYSNNQNLVNGFVMGLTNTGGTNYDNSLNQLIYDNPPINVINKQIGRVATKIVLSYCLPCGDSSKPYFSSTPLPGYYCNSLPKDTFLCKPNIVDTAVNPYRWGILGNWRMTRAYTYYDKRKQNDPTVETNIRKDGEIISFAPYWTFTNTSMTASTDTSRWVWNSEMTLFNRKGYEVENKDPLNRYNSGQYGYNQTMPVAVGQNSHNREMMFDGFEDYGYKTDTCISCGTPRFIDLVTAGGTLVDTISHTGKYSLRLAGNQSTATTIKIATNAEDSTPSTLSVKIDTVINKIRTTVNGTGTGLQVSFINSKSNVICDTTTSNVDYNWGYSSPPGCPNDYFHAVWTGKIQPRYTDVYTFSSTHDDAITVKIEDTVVINSAAATNSIGKTVTLTAGKTYKIEVDYTEVKGAASVNLAWKSKSIGQQISEIIPKTQLYYSSVTDASVSNTIHNDTTFCYFPRSPKPKKITLDRFSPLQNRQMVFSAWVKEEQACVSGSYANDQIVLAFNSGGSITLTPSGRIIEGWQRIEQFITIPATATSMTITLKSTSSSIPVYFDDIRMHPFNSNIKSFVYSPVNLRLMAELDENNYATFYEYDDDGTLIRLKKETERGIKTIKETRSALLKQ
jgi:PA14 domain